MYNNNYEDIITFARKFKTGKCPEGVEKYIQPGEVFKEITSDIIPGIYDYYQISNFGRIYHNYKQRIMKSTINGSGYRIIDLATENGFKLTSIHRLVLSVFNPVDNMNELYVNHINGVKTDNRLENLEWTTPKENIHHAYQTGLCYIGEDKPEATITNEIAHEICRLLESNKYTQMQIAEMCNTTPFIVNHIKNGEGWNHISCNYDFTPSREWRLFTDEQVHNICKYFQVYYRGNLSYNDHARNALNYYGYDISEKYVACARQIYRQTKYTNISKNYNFNSIVQRLSPNGR